MRPSPPSPGGAAAAAAEAAVVVGTWNMSTWSPAKAYIIRQEVGATILAVQETDLANFSLKCARSSCQALGIHFHHGHPVPAVAKQFYGHSCGVGFVTAAGAAVSQVLPAGAAWRRLHAMQRLHAVQLAPRPGLPRGIVLFSVYAPLQ